MADDKTVNLRVDGSPAAAGFKEIENAAEGAMDAVGDYASEADKAEAQTKQLGDALHGAADKAGALGVEIEKTEKNTKRLAGTSRDYNNAARSVGDSVQAITRFEAAYRASVNDTANSAQVRAQILAASFARTIGGAADEAKAAQLLATGHKDAGAAVQFMLANNAPLVPQLEKSATGYRNAGLLAQQASYQIADIAAVSAAGGNAFAAAGTQLGQFLGVLGPWGAAAGAAATVAGALAAGMMRVGDSAKDAASDQEIYKSGLNELVALEKDYNAALRERAGLSTEPSGTGSIDQRFREAQGRMRVLEGGDELSGKPAGGGQGFLGGMYDRAKERLGLGRSPNEYASAQAALSEAQSARISASDLIEATAKEKLAKIVGDLGNERAQELGLLRLSDKEREKATAALEAERQVRSALKNTGATKDQVEAEVAVARAHAETAVGMKNSATAAKQYVDAQKAVSVASVQMQANLALNGLDGEREALSQRRQLGEISAAEELAQAIGIADRKRAVEVSTAQQQLALLRKNHADNYTAIDTAERAITEMQAKHETERQKEKDAAALAAQQRAKQLAALDISASTGKGNDGVAVREENLSFGKQMGTINGSDEIAELRAIAEQKIQIRREELEATLQNGQIEEAERKRLNTELVGLERQRSLDMSKIDHQATLNRIAEIRLWLEPFKSAINTMVTSFISGTQTMRQIAGRAVQSIAASYVGKAASWGFDKAATGVVTGVAGKEAAASLGLGGGGDVAQTTALHANTIALDKLALALAGNTTATTTDVAATTTDTAVTATDTTATAASTVATTGNTTSLMGGFFSWLAGLFTNTTGDAANTGATAALTTAVAANTAVQGGSAAGDGAGLLGKLLPGFAVGAWNLPGDMVAQVHAGEMIVPADAAPGVRNMLTSGGLRSPSMAAIKAAIDGRAAALAMDSIVSGGAAAASAAGLIGPRMGLNPAMAAASPMVAPAGLAGLSAFTGGAMGGFVMPQMPVQRWGMPDELRRSPGAGMGGNVQNNTTNRGGDVHFSQTVNVTGKVRTDDIENFEAATVRALTKAQRNGNPGALSLSRKK